MNWRILKLFVSLQLLTFELRHLSGWCNASQEQHIVVFLEESRVMLSMQHLKGHVVTTLTTNYTMGSLENHLQILLII